MNYHFVTYGKVLREINGWFTNIKPQTYIPMYTRYVSAATSFLLVCVCVTNNNHTQLETFISPSWTKHPHITHIYSIKMILPKNCAASGMNAQENFK